MNAKYFSEEVISNTQNLGKILLVLGEEYHFSSLEEEILQKKFQIIKYIQYTPLNAHSIINQVSFFLQKREKPLVIINNRTLINSNLLNYLKKKNIEYLTIQNFMKKYLSKCYIPSYFNQSPPLNNLKPFNIGERFFKFIVDYTSAITILTITSPIMLYTLYKIKKESPGPIFFKQKRIGQNGKEFNCIKFRSMNIDAEKNGAQFAIKNDNRVYPWGKVMRATRIDELPQLWNVLKGDMHLIGPRPERRVWINEFEKKIPYYNKRHIVKPGLTGWAQVLYPYGSDTEDARQKLMYDLYYIKHWSIWLEIKTIWKTVMVVLMRKGV